MVFIPQEGGVAKDKSQSSLEVTHRYNDNIGAGVKSTFPQLSVPKSDIETLRQSLEAVDVRI